VFLGLFIFHHLQVGCQFIDWYHAVVNAHSSWTRTVVKRYMQYLPIYSVCGNAILVAKQTTSLSHPVHRVEKTDFLRACGWVMLRCLTEYSQATVTVYQTNGWTALKLKIDFSQMQLWLGRGGQGEQGGRR